MAAFTCPGCNKFAAYEAGDYSESPDFETEIENEDSENDATTVTFTAVIMLTVNSLCCGEALAAGEAELIGNANVIHASKCDSEAREYNAEIGDGEEIDEVRKVPTGKGKAIASRRHIGYRLAVKVTCDSCDESEDTAAEAVIDTRQLEAVN